MKKVSYEKTILLVVYLSALILLTFFSSCNKDVNVITNNVVTKSTENYKGVSSNQIRLKSKLWIDVKQYVNDANSWSYGDFDLDGDEDIFVARLRNSPILLDNINNTFIPKNIFDDLSYTIHPRSTIEGDYNGDGYLDIIIMAHEYEGANGGENVLLLTNQNGKTFKTNIISPVINGSTKNFWHLGSSADIDNDGDIDLLLSTAGQQYIMINDGNANFTLSTKYEQSLQNSHLIGGLLEDLNGDGYVDFYTFGHEFGGMYSFPNNKYHNGPYQHRIIYGNNEYSFLFNNSKTFKIDTSGFALGLDAISVDLDGDTKKELIQLRTGDPENYIFYKGYKIVIYSGNDYSDVTEKLYGKMENKDANWIVFLKVIDVNKDGKLDVCSMDVKNKVIFFQK